MGGSRRTTGSRSEERKVQNARALVPEDYGKKLEDYGQRNSRTEPTVFDITAGNLAAAALSFK